ncbi:MHYT domain-containing protein [Sphaerisporangium rubeum]|uniref:NO-binding membrane sensor protein with MHYT domain n=1 Tax=Sphaerisporangium rubeum TaxID=321317 RepID=A0A7X0IIG5_9ACTN|nr:MHYT domain-containing protein [Sphaerisporangium rubeum]MBB6474613.1 NO-binding membrane sensor protein with MHYT domain [Sphaerisporangium rubeum]
MSHIDHFSHGALIPVLSYAMSVIGSLLGLLLASRARVTEGAARTRWLVAAALAIGGTGIWVMHFIAMMGFSVPGTSIRYDVPLTVVSAFVAVVIVGIGLLLAARGGEHFPRLAGAGLITGLGVAAMHYLGMSAIRIPADLHYDVVTVAASVLIAVVAATAALWFTLRVEGLVATTAAALIMGVAVCGMHYTGMFSLSVSLWPGPAADVGGATALSFLLPLLIGISLVTLGLLLVVTLMPSRQEIENEAALLASIERRRAGIVPPQAPAAPARRPSLFDSGGPSR